MRLITLLKMDSDSNRFCVMRVRRDKKTGMITMDAESRKNTRRVCPHCAKCPSVYGSPGERFSDSIPPLGATRPPPLRYATRQMSALRQDPRRKGGNGTDGKNGLSRQSGTFLADWTRELTGKGDGAAFRHDLAEGQDLVVPIAPQRPGGVSAMGADEVAWRRGTDISHSYIRSAGDGGACPGSDQTLETLKAFLARCLRPAGNSRRYPHHLHRHMGAVSSLQSGTVSREADVLDRFRVLQMFGRALDKIWNLEATRLGKEERPGLLFRTRWCF